VTSPFFRNQTLRLWVVVALILLTATLTIPRLDTALWQDEYYSVFSIGGWEFGPLTLPGVWNRLAENDPWHTPGYFSILYLWQWLVGVAEPLALRTLSVLAGVLSLAWIYRIGRDFIRADVGVYAVAVLGTSAFFLHYVHEMRMYTLLTMFHAMMLWSYLKLTDRDYAGRWLWGVFFVGVLGLQFMHYFALLPIAGLGLYHLLIAPRRFSRGWWTVIGWVLAVQLIFLPWIPVLLDALNAATEQDVIRERALSPIETVGWLLHGLGNGQSWLAGGVLVLALGAYIVGRGEMNRRGMVLIGFVTLATLAVLLVGNAIAQMMHAGRIRYLMVLWVPGCLLLAVGLAWVGRWWRPLTPLAVAGWLVFGVAMSGQVANLFNFDDRPYILPTHEIERLYQPEARPGDFLYVFPPDNQETRHYRLIGDFYLKGLGDGYTIVNVRDLPERDTDDPVVLAAGIGDRERVWVASMPDQAPPQLEPFLTRLADDYTPCQQVRANGIDLALYTRSEICCGQTPPEPEFVFNGGASLMSVEPTVVSDGLVVDLAWAGGDLPELQSYSFGLYLMPNTSDVVAQVNLDLPDYDYACQTASIPLQDVPPGAYTLRTTVYSRDTGEPLNIDGEVVVTLRPITIPDSP
jgi:hypothetical protein